MTSHGREDGRSIETPSWGRNVDLLMMPFRWTAVALAVLVAAGCATTGRTISSAESAVQSGDYDTAVALYRQALAKDPERIELRIALERTTRTAAADHVKRAREFEAQDQLTGALAEYRLAADLDPTSTVATTKALELQRRLRELSDASRPQTSIDTLRQQASQTSPMPRIDPRLQVPELRSTASVRDLLTTISNLTGINITYDSPLLTSQALNQPYSVDIASDVARGRLDAGHAGEQPHVQGHQPADDLRLSGQRSEPSEVRGPVHADVLHLARRSAGGPAADSAATAHHRRAGAAACQRQQVRQCHRGAGDGADDAADRAPDPGQ